MVTGHFSTRRGAAFALTLILAAGCHNPGTLSTSATTGTQGETPAPLTDGQRADLKIALGRSLENGGDIDHAIGLYTEAVAIDPKRVDAYLRLAALHQQQGRSKESTEWFHKAVALQPNNADVYCSLGYSLYLQGNWVEAGKHFQHALLLNPNHARAHNNFGLVLARQGQMDGALAEFKKAGCSDADARINLAYCSLLDGNTIGSRQHLELALKLDPNSGPAKKALLDLNGFMTHQQPSRPSLSLQMPTADSPAATPQLAWKEGR